MQELKLKDLEQYNLFINKDSQLILIALMTDVNKIEVRLKEPLNSLPLIQVFNNKKKQISNLQIQYFENKNILEITGEFKHAENYILKINNESSYVIIDPKIGGILDEHYFCEDNDFGLTFIEDSVKFKMWSPTAVKVELLFFKNEKPVLTQRSVNLKSSKPGIWELEIKPGDFGIKSVQNLYYQYRIRSYGKEFKALDPYAKSMQSFNPYSDDKIGKAAVINFKSLKIHQEDLTKNYSNNDFIDSKTDLVIYEINVRDFTIEPGCTNEKLSGTFLGLIKKIDYLKKLGITHVQLMPVNKAYTQIEYDRSYTGKTASKSNYNWGYDPMNFFTLEGRYSTDPSDPYCRINEFKKMVQALHNAGIGIILDVVFNHTYLANTFENLAPGCYYRLKDNYEISGLTGAGATIESRRKQVSKFITDVLKFFVKEYHIDGFRFDLMSFFDKTLMQMIREEVGKAYNPKNIDELILHGEAWNFTDLKKNAITKYDHIPKITAIFNDSLRDALIGNFPHKGYINGNIIEISRLASGIIGGIKSYDSECLPFNKDIFYDPYHLFTEEPEDCLNYISIHDGLTLWDKINLTVKDESKRKRLSLMKLAYSFLLTSQGKVILHAGDEILRSKPLSDFDLEKKRALTSIETDIEEGTLYFHENSYCSNDYTNMIRWTRLTNEYSELSNELSEYLKGLIKLRRTYKAFRFETADDIRTKVRFIDNDCEYHHKINSFHSYKLKHLKIKFINGPVNETLFLAGEIHMSDPNPINNPFALKFDHNGVAEIVFTRSDISNFDLYKWDKSRNLNFKLVKTKGSWDYPKFAYSEFGHNSASPESINDNFEVLIDLNIQDYKLLHQVEQIEPKPYFSVFINDNTEKNVEPNKYSKFLIVHNVSNFPQTIFLEQNILKYNWDVLVDNSKTGSEKIIDSPVKFVNNRLIVPEISTAVLASV